jgi:hypothetical protein
MKEFSSKVETKEWQAKEKKKIHIKGQKTEKNLHKYIITAVAANCCTVKVASDSMARISSGDCCGGATRHRETKGIIVSRLLPNRYPNRRCSRHTSSEHI